MVLEDKLDSAGLQSFLGLDEVDSIHLEGDVLHDGGAASVRRVADRAFGLEQREGRIARAHHYRIVTPCLCVAALQTENVAIPRDRLLDVTHGERDVVKPLHRKHGWPSSFRRRPDCCTSRRGTRDLPIATPWRRWHAPRTSSTAGSRASGRRRDSPPPPRPPRGGPASRTWSGHPHTGIRRWA